MTLISEQIQNIGRLLNARIEQRDTETVLTFGGGTSNTGSVVLTITPLPDGSSVLSAQTIHGYFELHDTVRFVAVDPDEVIFIAEQGDRINGLVVGATGACSLFANVRRSTLSADFTTIEPALLLAAMQLGLAENITV